MTLLLFKVGATLAMPCVFMGIVNTMTINSSVATAVFAAGAVSGAALMVVTLLSVIWTIL